MKNQSSIHSFISYEGRNKRTKKNQKERIAEPEGQPTTTINNQPTSSNQRTPPSPPPPSLPLQHKISNSHITYYSIKSTLLNRHITNDMSDVFPIVSHKNPFF